MSNLTKTRFTGLLSISVWFIFLFSSALSGCSCPTGPNQQLVQPELKIEAQRPWQVGTNELLPGLPTYQTFTIINAAPSGAESLVVFSIKMSPGGSKQFKLVDGDCPKFAPTEERPNEKGLEKYCVNGPSLPDKIPPGQGIKFTLTYTHTTETIQPRAELAIVSNKRNKLQAEKFTDRYSLAALLGAARIDVAGLINPKKDKIFISPMGKVKKGQSAKPQEFVLTNVGKADLEFKLSWKTANPNFTLTDQQGRSVLQKALKLPPNDSRTFLVRYHPKSCGAQAAELLISSNAIESGPDTKNGYSVSGRQLTVRVAGSSPAKAEVTPQNLVFEQAGSKTFSIKVDSASYCDVEIKKLSIGQAAGAEPPKSFSIGTIRKNGKAVSLPTTLSYGSQESLTVEILFQPENKDISEIGVVQIESSDESLVQAPVTLYSKSKFNFPPRPSFFFVCDEENSKACKKGEQLPGSANFNGERRIKVLLDSSKSFDANGKIVSYKWTLVRKPEGSGTQISDPSAATPSFIVDSRGSYTVRLEVTDDQGKKSSQPAEGTLKVED